MDADKLNIPTHRRVAGGIMLLLSCLAAVAYLYSPVWDTAQMPETIDTAYIGIFMLVGIVWLMPTVFFPCLFDRFPQWVLRHPAILRRARARLGLAPPAVPH